MKVSLNQSEWRKGRERNLSRGGIEQGRKGEMDERKKESRDNPGGKEPIQQELERKERRPAQEQIYTAAVSSFYLQYIPE